MKFIQSSRTVYMGLKIHHSAQGIKGMDVTLRLTDLVSIFFGQQ